MITVGLDARPAFWYPGTGIGNYTRQLLRHLVALDPGHRFRLLWPDLEPLPDLPPRFEATALGRDRRMEQAFFPGWLEAQGVDVHHVPQNGLHAPMALGRARLVITVHDLIPLVLPEAVSHGYASRFLREVPAAVARSRLIIAVSEHAAQDLERLLGAPRSKIRVVHPAPEECFRPLPPAEAAWLAASRYGVTGPYAVYLGGLNPRKNLFDLLYAFSKVCRALDPQTTLVVAGESERYLPPLRSLAHLLGLDDYVIFPGRVAQEDLAALYGAASFALYPSLYEGFGLPPLEAMSCGTPVICSAAASLPEVVGDAAVLVPPGDVTALGQAMLRLAADADLRERLRVAGLARADRFSWARAAAAVASIYEEAAQEEPAAG